MGRFGQMFDLAPLSVYLFFLQNQAFYLVNNEIENSLKDVRVSSLL